MISILKKPKTYEDFYTKPSEQLSLANQMIFFNAHKLRTVAVCKKRHIRRSLEEKYCRKTFENQEH